MVVFVSIVFFCTCIKLVFCDLCDPNHGSEGAYDCVKMPMFKGYQWAVCLSSQSLKTHTSGYMDCHGSAFCWLPCTLSLYPKVKHGHVANKCICDPTENERRKRSLLAEGRKMEVTVSPICYIPAMESNCQWYSVCLETHSSCEESDFHYAISYGRAICSIFLESFNSFSEDGKNWIASSQKCIEDRLRSVLMPNDTSDCKNIHDRAYQAHTDCYLRRSNPGFCSLQHLDQMKIYWSIKQVYQNAFSEYFDEVMAKFRTCLRNDVYGEQIEYIFYVEKSVNEIYEVEEKDFAMALAEKFEFSSHGVDWDVNINTYNRSRSKRDTDFARSKMYQPVRVLVSRKQVDIVDRSRRSPNQYHLRKTDESEYDKGFLENLEKNITNGLKEENFQVLDIDVKMRTERTIGLLVLTGGAVWSCFLSLFTCIPSVLAIYSYRQGVLPDTPKDIDPKFILHSRSTSDIHLSFLNASSLSHFDHSKPTYIIVHGYHNSGDEDWIQNMRSCLLDKKDSNVIVVDWEKGAKYWYHRYTQAAVNTEVVGTILALLVESLEHHRGASKTHIHIIGHSLGAHVAGFAGSAHKETRYQRITGMDPAGPFFRDKDENARLDKTDAHFVDVIHTNGGYLGYLGLGYLDPMGHLDFYPNGGENQPGCSVNISCSHSRAYQFFTESVLSDQKFQAWKCESLDQCKSGKGIDTTRPPDNRMGYYTENVKETKMYYLTTNEKSPYSNP